MSRLLGISALVLANALCAFCLWKFIAAEPRSTRAAQTAPELVLRAPVSAADPRAEAAPPRQERDPRLEARVQKRIGDAIARAVRDSKGKLEARQVRVAVCAHEAGATGDLVALDAERAMRPASSLKLVTTAAALVLLGRGGAFATVFESDAPIVAGRLAGDLVVRAGGDPLYDSRSPGGIEAWFDRLVGDLREQGVGAVDGALVLDEGDFDEPAPGPAWPAASQHHKEFCALAGGFSVNSGCLTATVRAMEAGRPAEVAIEPRHHGFVEKLRVDTVGARAALEIGVEVRNGSALVAGSIPKDVPEWSARCAVPDPVELFGRVLTGALAERGILVREGWKRERRGSGVRRMLARIETPIAGMLSSINTDSNNACADQLFLALGHAIEGAGTRAGGGAATVRALEELGVASDGLVQVDGSGLSRDNRVSARQISALISAVLRLDAQTARLFVDSLAVGAESGTLDDRMRNPALAGRVHAKTGFIAGTSALAGLIDARDGRVIVFSMMVEYPPIDGLNQSCWKPMQDAICAELARFDPADSDG